LPDEFVLRRLKNCPADGHLILGNWGRGRRHLLESLREPVLYFSLGDEPLAMQCYPMVNFDTGHAIRRAVHLMAKAGLRRIALLDWRPAEARQMDLLPYAHAREECGLEYRRAVLLDSAKESTVAAACGELLQGPDRPEGIYVADDHLLAGLVLAVRQAGLRLGEDLAVITIAMRGMPLADGYEWSRLEFDLTKLAGSLVNGLVRRIQQPVEELDSIAFRARWVPGRTHRP
jgi:DNA-binding LacI/PurR family transcriptional regulator